MANPNSAWRSPWVIGWIGLVVTVLSVNAYMVYMSFTTMPGLVNSDYYEQGQNYERTMNERRVRAQALDLDVRAPARPVRNEPATFLYIARDTGGVPLEGESATLHAYRPANERDDFSVPMVAEGNGQYRAEVSFPLKGVWDVVVSLKQGEGEVNAARRVMVRDSQ